MILNDLKHFVENRILGQNCDFRDLRGPTLGARIWSEVLKMTFGAFECVLEMS